MQAETYVDDSRVKATYNGIKLDKDKHLLRVRVYSRTSNEKKQGKDTNVMSLEGVCLIGNLKHELASAT